MAKCGLNTTLNVIKWRTMNISLYCYIYLQPSLYMSLFHAVQYWLQYNVFSPVNNVQWCYWGLSFVYILKFRCYAIIWSFCITRNSSFSLHTLSNIIPFLAKNLLQYFHLPFPSSSLHPTFFSSYKFCITVFPPLLQTLLHFFSSFTTNSA